MSDDRLKLLLSELGQFRVKAEENHSFTGLYYIATSRRELIKSINLCRDLQIPFFLLGSSLPAHFPEKKFTGLVIKNRDDTIKVVGIKGKVGRGGLGLSDATLEIDSGASLGKINDYLTYQRLIPLDLEQSLNLTIGEVLLEKLAVVEGLQSVSVLDKTGQVINQYLDNLSKEDIIISAVIKFRGG